MLAVLLGLGLLGTGTCPPHPLPTHSPLTRFSCVPAASGASANPGVANCTVHHFSQDLDHFGFVNKQKFSQRYFVCV